MNFVLFVLMFRFLYINFYFSKPKRVATSKFAFISKDNFKMHMFKESKVCIVKSSFSTNKDY
ncbi:hypothetical protein BWO94_06260 [Staphylococcus aureus]|nr:hypothetical protein BRL61_00290 [Staphylococcus aureus]KAB2170415.1 hypothetical protein F9B30_12790 [Staphylococcus epidermidis]AUU47174.1 hypothetical protein RK78_003335 [Staphylococcus aureus]AUU62305.1 hypothetical protein RK88_011440 [Staphylococcus aureus]AVS43384.1 hypothetical protein C9J86_05100 [Staphylococcus aureus]